MGLEGEELSFSDPERAFLAVLQQAVGSKFYVLGKVKVLDVFSFENEDKLYPRMVAKALANTRFDYLICDKETSEIVCVVELEEVLQQKYMQQKWLRFLGWLVQKFCTETSLARLIVQQQRGYLLDQLIDRFEAVTSQFSASLS